MLNFLPLIEPLTKFLAQGFLLLTREYFIIIFVSIGFLVLNRQIFGKALFLFLFTMILNTFLKSLWQIPLPQSLGEGYSFPSGHMQTSFVLWGWLAFEFKNRTFTSLVLLLLFGIAFGLIYFGYHSVIDIAGAISFGLLTLIFYYYFLKIFWIKNHIPMIGLVFILFSLPIMIMLRNNPGSIWTATGGLLGFSLGWITLEKNSLNSIVHYYSNHNPKQNSLKNKITLITIVLLGVFFIKFCIDFGLAMGALQLSKSMTALLSTFLVGFWVNIVPLIRPSGTFSPQGRREV